MVQYTRHLKATIKFIYKGLKVDTRSVTGSEVPVSLPVLSGVESSTTVRSYPLSESSLLACLGLTVRDGPRVYVP